MLSTPRRRRGSGAGRRTLVRAVAAGSGSVQSSNSSRRAPPRSEPADVRPLGVGALELLVGEVAVLVPLLLLGDAEVDEGLVPDVGEAHASGMVLRGRQILHFSGPAVAEDRRADPDVRRALLDRDAVVLARAHRELRGGRAPRRARAGGGSTAATLPGRRRTAASSSARARRGRARGTRASSPGRDARLRRLAAQVDLDERRDRRACAPPTRSRASGRARRAR